MMTKMNRNYNDVVNYFVDNKIAIMESMLIQNYNPVSESKR